MATRGNAIFRMRLWMIDPFTRDYPVSAPCPCWLPLDWQTPPDEHQPYRFRWRFAVTAAYWWQRTPQSSRGVGRPFDIMPGTYLLKKAGVNTKFTRLTTPWWSTDRAQELLQRPKPTLTAFRWFHETVDEATAAQWVMPLMLLLAASPSLDLAGGVICFGWRPAFPSSFTMQCCNGCDLVRQRCRTVMVIQPGFAVSWTWLRNSQAVITLSVRSRGRPWGWDFWRQTLPSFVRATRKSDLSFYASTDSEKFCRGNGETSSLCRWTR